MATAAVEGAQYLGSRPLIIAYTASAPSTPVSANNIIVSGSYYFTPTTGCWVTLGKSNTDVGSAVPTGTQPATATRTFWCAAEENTPVDIAPGVTAYVTAIAETTAGNLRISGPIGVAPLG